MWYFTERSHNHRTVVVGRDLCGSSSPTLLPKQGHLQQAAQDLVQAGLEYLQRRRHLARDRQIHFPHVHLDIILGSFTDTVLDSYKAHQPLKYQSDRGHKCSKSTCPTQPEKRLLPCGYIRTPASETLFNWSLIQTHNLFNLSRWISIMNKTEWSLSVTISTRSGKSQASG